MGGHSRNLKREGKASHRGKGGADWNIAWPSHFAAPKSTGSILHFSEFFVHNS